MTVKVQTPSFEGPLDLLLHLILKDDVDIYDVNLGDIVDSYLVELERIKACNLDIATEFLLIAATLVELKCRRLLPSSADIDLDEELALWEERDVLLARLLECKTFKDAAEVLQTMLEVAQLSMPRAAGLEDRFLELTPDPLAGMTPMKLRRAFLRQVEAKPEPTVSLAHVSAIRASVTDAIEELTTTLPTRSSISFRSFTEGLEDKLEVVVRFLAVLELFKQGIVDIDQLGTFGDLTISWIPQDQRSTGELVGISADSYEG